MLRVSVKLWMVALLLALATLPLLMACSSDDEETPAVIEQPTASVEDVTITIGNISDVTRGASASMRIVSLGVEDAIKHFNEQNLIPWLELQLTRS